MNTAENMNTSKWYEEYFIDAINAAISTSLTYDDESSKKLAVFEGKVIKVVLESTPFTFYMVINKCEVNLSKHYEGKADTTIKGTPLALFAMNSEEPVAGIKSVEIQGDASTGQFFAKWLKNLKPDWTEAWQDLLGDNIGEKVSNGIAGLLDFGKKFKDTIISSSSDFLKNESQDLISPKEMNDFCEDVDDLQADTNRLEKQINALKN